MTQAASAAARDLGVERGLSARTLQLFGVKNGADGWEYRTALAGGGAATRVKCYDRDASGRKYYWKPNKPADAEYFYPPGRDIKQAIDAAWGTVYLVGGDIAAMSMFEAGLDNTLSFFGDKVPVNLLDLLRSWDVLFVKVIGDRDKSGEAWCCKIRDALKDQLEIKVEFRALPYPVADKGGKDVNDYWLDYRASGKAPDAFAEALDALPIWRLPEPEPVEAKSEIIDASLGSDALPEAFIRDIEIALGVSGQVVNSKGYTKLIRCPFHEDDAPSAAWNREMKYLKCFAASCGNHNAKEVGEHFGIRLRDYVDAISTVPARRISPSSERERPTTTGVLSVAPTSDAARPTAPALAPALPEFARLSAAQIEQAAGGRRWLDEYVAWACGASPLTPEIFHEAIGITLLAMVSTRRVKITLGGENIYPNLYTMLVGKSTIYRKSTAFKLAQRVIADAKLHFLTLPGDATPEALFDEMAGVRPINFKDLPISVQQRWKMGRVFAAQRMIMKDEASSIFAAMKKEYNAGLTEILLQGYDGDTGTWEKILKSRGLISVRDMCLSFLGATTPTMWARHVGQEETDNGFAARFAIVTPESVAPYRTPDDEPTPPEALSRALRQAFMTTLKWDTRICDEHGQPNAGLLPDDGETYTQPVITATADADALRQMELYRKALGYDLVIADALGEDKAPAYGRLATMMVKVALLFAMIDARAGGVRIEARHAYAAQLLVERWRESLHRLDDAIARARYEGKDERVLTYLRNAGARGATLRAIMRDCGLGTKQHATDLLVMLADENLIEKIQIDTGKPGRKPVCFRLIGDYSSEGKATGIENP